MDFTLPELPDVLDIAAPDRLAALVAGGASLLIIGALISRRKRGVVLAPLALTLRGGALAVLVFLLLEPFVRREEKHPGVLLASVDLSRSVDDAARNQVWDAIRHDVTGDPEPRRVVFGFGERVRGLDPRGPAPGGDDADDLASDPAGSVDALMLGPEVAHGSARLVFASDGAIPDPRGVPSVPGMRPQIIALGAGPSPNVQADRLEVVETPTREKPVQMVWHGSATAEGRAVLVVHVDGREVRRVAVNISPGALQIPLTTPPLPSGTHVIAAHMVFDGPLGAATDDALDNGAATRIRIESAPKVLVVSDVEQPLVLAALKAQELDVERVDVATITADPFHAKDAGVVVLDRISAETLSDPQLYAGLKRRVERGGGLLYLPRIDVGEMFDARAKPFLDLLPLVGQPPPPPEPKKPEPPKPDPKALKPPDPEKPRKKEKRKAPSLGLLLVVDASSSMKDGGRLRLAKEAAIAAAEVLHPKDYVGAIQFNTRASIVLEMTPSGDKTEIVDRLSRIKAEGGTNFGPALELAEEIFMSEDLAIRHVILLSDGQSREFRLKPLVTRMAKAGITVSTVGCGGAFDEAKLSDIAHWGKGRFHPAFDAREIPQIFTIEAERVIKESGARHRNDAEAKPSPAAPESPPYPPTPDPNDQPENPEPPKPPKAIPFQLGLPAPYMGGITPHDVPGLLGMHPTIARTGAWVALETTEDKSPVLAHQALGYGRVAAFALPLEGPWAGHVVGWNDYQTLLAQLVRFLHPNGRRERFHLMATGHGRAIEVRILDREARTLPEDIGLAIRDARGRSVRAKVDRVADDRFIVRLDPKESAAGIVATVVDGFGAAFPGGAGIGFASTAPPPEVAERGLDLQGLEAWAAALGGEVLAHPPQSIHVPARVTVDQMPWGDVLLPWLLLLLCVDFLLRRLWPGRLE